MDYVLPPYATINDAPHKPSKPQAEFHRLASSHTYTMFCGGLGSGKSWALCQQFVQNILENREELQRRGQGHVRLTYVIGAPTYQDIHEGVWEHVNRILDEYANLNSFDLRKGKPRLSDPREIRLVTGDILKFVATDPKRFKAANIAGWGFDESEEAQDPMGGFKLLNGRLRDARAPRLFGIVASTPTVSGQGVEAHFKEQIAKGNQDYVLVRAHSETNPANDHNGYVERSAETMSERERRVRLGGESLPPENAVYGLEFDPHESIAHNWVWYGKPRADREYHLIIDWGGHYFGGIVEHDPKTGIDVVIDEVILDGVQDETFLDALVQACEKRGIRKDYITSVWCDYNPFHSVQLAYSARYWKGKVRARRVENHQQKQQGIDTVRWRLCPARGPRLLLLAPHLKQTPGRRGLYQSLQAYTWQERTVDRTVVMTNFVNQDSPASHSCDAARYYCWQKYSHLRAVQ